MEAVVKNKTCYECLNCESIIVTEAFHNNIKCCKNPELKLVWTERDDAKERLNEAFEQAVEIIQKYMDLEEEKCKLIALWILGTYFHSEFSAFPFLFINAMRGSGKTRLLNLIAHLSKGSEGAVQTGLTESVLFRSPPGETMILDECESIASKDKGVLREYLNACYKKGGIVKRMKKTKIDGKEQYVVEKFHPYKPIAMANIWGMEEVLGDRCITLILEKSDNPGKTKLIEDFSQNPKIEMIKRTFEQFSVAIFTPTLPQNPQKQALQPLYSPSVDSVCRYPPGVYIAAWNSYVSTLYTNNIINITNTNDTIKSKTEEEQKEEIFMDELFRKVDMLGISGRNFELLFPMVLLSSYLSPELLEETLAFGKKIMESKKESEFAESLDVSLYEFISNIKEDEMISLKQLTNHFKLWRGESSDEWINERWLNRALKRLNLAIDTKRLASGRFVLLDTEKAKKKLNIFKKEERE